MKKILFGTFGLFLALCILNINNVQASARPQNLIDEILSQPAPDEGTTRPHVTFDIDGTLLEIDNYGYQKQTSIMTRFPDSLVAPYLQNGKLRPHIFYPYVMETILGLLERGWNVDIFSSAAQGRNEQVMEMYLKHMLAKYTPCPVRAYRELMSKKRMRIFSQADLVELRRDRALPLYDRGGSKKKDLRKLGVDTEWNVLVEDDLGYVMAPEQMPPIDIRFPFFQDKFMANQNPGCKDWYYARGRTFATFGPIKDSDGQDGKPTTYDEVKYPQQFYMPCCAGILGLCADLIKSGDITLREALKTVLTREDLKNYFEDEDVQAKIARAMESPETSRDFIIQLRDAIGTPWHMFRSGTEVPEETLQMWVDRGQAEIDRIKARRLTDYVQPENPFKAMFEDMYGPDFIMENLLGA